MPSSFFRFFNSVFPLPKGIAITNNPKTSIVNTNTVIFDSGRNRSIRLMTHTITVMINALLRHEDEIALTFAAASPSWNFGLSRTPKIIFFFSGFLGNPIAKSNIAELTMHITSISFTIQIIAITPYSL